VGKILKVKVLVWNNVYQDLRVHRMQGKLRAGFEWWVSHFSAVSGWQNHDVNFALPQKEV